MNAKMIKILEEIVKETPYNENQRMVASTIEDVLRRHDKTWNKRKQKNFEARCGIGF